MSWINLFNFISISKIFLNMITILFTNIIEPRRKLLS